MTTAIDQYSANHMIEAVRREMLPKGGKANEDFDTLFMGGTLPDRAQKVALANFGRDKNYKIVFLSFDPNDVAAGPTAIDIVVTDGLEQTMTLEGARLWKRDRQSPVVLVLAGLDAIVRLNANGRMIIREDKGPRREQGYQLACDAITARAARKPATAPVVSWIGSLLTIQDLRTLSQTLAIAA